MTLESLVRVPDLWITIERTVADGRRCRDYCILDAAGTALLGARAFNWSRDIGVRAGTDRPMLLLRRRRSFPVSGRVDVLSEPVHERIGVVSRNGRVAGADGRAAGRFVNARSLRERARESVLLAAFEMMLGGEGGSDPASPNGYVFLVQGRPAGVLALRRLPFATEPDRPPSAAARIGARLMPSAARRLASAFVAPRGWLLQRQDPAQGDAVLIFGAALFMVELSQW